MVKTRCTAFDLLKQIETAMHKTKKTKVGSRQLHEEGMGVASSKNMDIYSGRP